VQYTILEPEEKGKYDSMNKDETIFGIRVGYIQVAILAIVLILIMGALVGKVTAANQSYYVTTIPTTEPTTAIPTPEQTPIGVNTPLPTPTPIPTNVTVRRLSFQGECVQLGETIDLSGIGWYTGYIAYYNKYRTLTTEGMNASKIYEIQPWELRHYYVDPLKFQNFPGNWYSHYEYVETGNSMLFKVSEGNCTKPNETSYIPKVVENKTVVLLAENFTLTPKTLPNIDYIVSRNIVSSFETEFDSYYWMFGSTPNDKLYDIPVTRDGMITFSKDFSNNLPVGDYKIIDVYPGENFIMEEHYDRNITSIVSPFRDIAPVQVGNLSPYETMNILKEQVKKSIDDSVKQINITVEDPYIEIRRLDNLANADGTNSIMMSGYTNANIGDKIKLEFDKGNIDKKLIPANTWVVDVVDGGGSNAYRTWYKIAIFNPDDFVTGTHTITATTDSGAWVNAPVFIRKELAENYKPPAYIQYIDNNPFVPTPTPITLPQVTVTVVQTIVKTEIIEKEKIVTVDPYPYVIGSIVAMIVIIYALYTISRAYMKARRIRNEKKE
jgi:hypothetical protein